jgi:hypothetical protein
MISEDVEIMEQEMTVVEEEMTVVEEGSTSLFLHFFRDNHEATLARCR